METVTLKNENSRELIDTIQTHAKALLAALARFENMEDSQYSAVSSEVDRLCDMNLRDLESLLNAVTHF